LGEVLILEEKNENQNLPDSAPEEKRLKLKVRINNEIYRRREEAKADGILYVPLKEQKKDESAVFRPVGDAAPYKGSGNCQLSILNSQLKSADFPCYFLFSRL
jgi:hypothetical protein